MHMKTKYLLMAAAVMLLGSCTKWLTEEQPDTTKLEDYYTSGAAALQNVTACYVPLQWEYGETYFSEWFIGDIMSDDAVKGGGSLNDMPDAYDMENWRTQIDNSLVRSYWRANFLGIARCNLALENIPKMKNDSSLTVKMQNRLLGEAHFLRAYYYFRLVRAFGGVPVIDHVVMSDTEWNIPRSSTKDVYKFIISDLEFAQQNLILKTDYAFEDWGRATKGAAEAMLQKVNLYLASDGNAAARADGKSAMDYYQAARVWGDSVINSTVYDLCPAYADNFTLEGENGIESVFEIQYIGNEGDGTGDYGNNVDERFGATRGTFTLVLTRSRSSVINTLGDGWGFNHPTENLYKEFEEGDIRRSVAIYRPNWYVYTDEHGQPVKTVDGKDSVYREIVSPAEEIYLKDSLISRKYGLYNTVYTEADAKTCVTIYKNGHQSRGPLNNRQIRYADVLLMQAEAYLGMGNASKAKDYINMVRARVGLSLLETSDVDWTALRHERRCELAMEGHRWFDLCRWGIAYETMTAYEATETQEYKDQLALGGGFQKGKHELLPIPLKERELDPALEQNPGY